MSKEAMELALEALTKNSDRVTEMRAKIQAITAIKEALADQPTPVPPPWWPAVENILNEYGLKAIDFVADFKSATQQPAPVQPVDEMLTHDEWDALQDQCEEMVSHNFRLAVLAKLREKLAAQQENYMDNSHDTNKPVAWEGKTKLGFPIGSHKLIFTDKVRADEWLSEFVEGHAWLEPLYTSPPVQQETVAGCACRWSSEGDRVVTCERHQGWLEVIAEWADRARDAEKKLKALNTPPPQRQPLTDGDIRRIVNNAGLEPSEMSGEVFYAMRCVAVEAAHGIKE